MWDSHKAVWGNGGYERKPEKGWRGRIYQASVTSLPFSQRAQAGVAAGGKEGCKAWGGQAEKQPDWAP